MMIKSRSICNKLRHQNNYHSTRCTVTFKRGRISYLVSHTRKFVVDAQVKPLTMTEAKLEKPHNTRGQRWVECATTGVNNP